MIDISPSVSIDEREIEMHFVRSPGPGGQNVNKVATAVELRFNVEASSLPPPVKERLASSAGRRISNEGVLVIKAQRFRTQERNRDDAMQRLVELIRRAAFRPKPRIQSKPTVASRGRRLLDKRRLAEKKRGRGRQVLSEE